MHGSDIHAPLRARQDPKMRPKPISPEQREDVIVHMAAGLLAGVLVFPGASAGQSQCSPE